MNIIVQPGRLAGTVRVPASKSAAHRALICAALADAPTDIRLNASNRDIEATAHCLAALLGTDIRPVEGGLRVTPSAIRPKSALLDCGESGSTLRFLLPVAAALGIPTCFTGHGRLPERPNAALTDALRAHGAGVDADTLPMNVQGPVTGGRWALPGNVSSQYVTGLLFALPLLAEDSEIALTTPLESSGYVDMTLDALRQFGIEVLTVSGGWRVPGGQAYRSPGELEVDGDWSAAAFWLAANALGSYVRLEGLRPDSPQGDRAFPDLMGREEIDVRDVPDLVPALAAAAALMPQRTRITGAARLRLKESDRLATTAAMINAMGGRAEAEPDGLIVDGGLPLTGGTVDGANDHRIVMAAAILAAAAQGPTRITGAEAVEKSYPDFFRDFNQLGGRAHVESTGQ